MYKQGDVILVPFPFTDLSGSKLRPALIVSSELVNQSNDLVCVQITSKSFSDLFFFTLSAEDIHPRLPLDSGIRLHKLFTISKVIVVKKLGILQNNIFDKVLNAIQQQVLTKT